MRGLCILDGSTFFFKKLDGSIVVGHAFIASQDSHVNQTVSLMVRACYVQGV